MTRRGAFLAVIALVAALAGVWASDEVAVPLAYALFALGAVEPLRRTLEKRAPTWVAVLAAFLVTLAVFAALITGIVFSFKPVYDDWARYEDELETWRRQATAFADSIGMSLSGEASQLGKRVADGVTKFISGLVLAIGFFLLAGSEVVPYDRAVKRAMPVEAAERLMLGLRNTAKDVRIYLFVRTVVGLLTGGLVVAASYAMGLDLPWVWGSLNFLLNYIPTIGSVLAVVPPVLFAQAMGGWTHALLALAAVGGVQLVMGVVVDPLLQGKQLSISPLAILISVAFWGWMWGIAGAFIATPMTMVVVRVCQQFEQSRWVYELLVREDREGTDR